MQSLREWIICITLCSAGCSLLYTLIPRGAMEKSMKTVISLFLIAALASPLTGLLKNGIDLSLPQQEYTHEYGRHVSSALLSATEQAVRDCVFEASPELRGTARVEVRAAVDEENTVFIEYIRIALNGSGLNAEEIKSKLYEKLQLTAEVTQ